MKKKPAEKRFPSDKPNGAFEKWLHDVAKELVGLYKLGAIKIYYKKAKPGDSDHPNAVFNVNYSLMYRMATITYFPMSEQMFEEKSFSALTTSIVHEFAHIVTEPLAQAAEDRYMTQKELKQVMESVTEHVAHLAHQILEERDVALFKGIV